MQGLVAYEIDDDELNGDAIPSDSEAAQAPEMHADPDITKPVDLNFQPSEPAAEPSEDLAKSAGNQLDAEHLKLPQGECDPKLQEKVANFIRIQREMGRQVKSELRASRQYRNPDFLQKMVEAVDIQEAASNFPPEIFDPFALHKEDYYEALKAQWEQQQERHAQKRKASGHIEFTSGSAKQKTSTVGKSAIASDAVQRARAVAAKQNSRWDSRPLSR